MRRTTVLTLFVLAGCWSRWEKEYDERWAEMADHEDDALAAVSAVASGNLDAAHEAAKGLARTDEVPRLPEQAVPMLATIRARGQILSETTSRVEAAKHLIALSGECRACHAALEVDTLGREADTAEQRAWLALVWKDEATWAASGLEGDDWAARAKTLRTRLEGDEGSAPEAEAPDEDEAPTPEAPTPR